MTDRLNTDSLISAIGVDIYDFNPRTGVETVRRFGSTEFTDSGSNDYEALIANTGVHLGNQFNDTLGGLQSLSWTATVNLVNTEHVTELINYNTLINNRVDIRMFIWDSIIRDDPAEEITLYSGKVKSREFTDEIWVIQLEHVVTDLIQSFPTLLVSPANYPRTDPNNFGSPVPHVFGSMDRGPFDGEGKGARLARCMDVSNSPHGGFLPGHEITTRGDMFEYNSGAWYQVVDKEDGLVTLDPSDGSMLTDDSDSNISTITSSKRLYRNYIAFPTTSNRLAGWEVLADGYANTSIQLASNLNVGETFQGLFSASSDRGAINTVTLVIERRGVQEFIGNWGVTLSIDGDNKLVGDRGDILTDTFKYVHEVDETDLTWNDLAQLTLTIPRLDVDITQVYLEIELLRKEDDTLPVIYQKVTGFNSDNPVAHIYEILSGSTLCNIPASDLLVESFADAAVTRVDWNFNFQVDKTSGKDLVNRILQECSAFLYIRDNKIACGVRTNTQQPTAAMIDPADIRYSGQGLFCDFLPENRIVNDVALRYGLDTASGKYYDIEISSSLSRISSPTPALYASDHRGTFWNLLEGLSPLPVVGDKVFDFNTGGIFTVTKLDDYFLYVTPTPTLIASIIYGPNITAKSVRSRYINRVIRSMGGAQPNFTELGAYNNEFISDGATAKLWVDNVLDALADPPLIAKLATYWKYARLHIGDTILFDSPAIPENARPGIIGQLHNFMPALPSMTWVSMDRSTIAGIGDYLLIGSEVIEVVRPGPGFYHVNRGALGSEVAAHSVGDDVRLFTSKFQVKNKVSNLNTLTWSFTVERATPNYIPTSFFGSNSGRITSDPSLEQLSDNFTVSSANGLINERRPGQFGSQLLRDDDGGIPQVTETTTSFDEVNAEVI